MQQAPHDRQELSLLSLMVSAYEDADGNKTTIG
jgi:hypothetical protein